MAVVLIIVLEDEDVEFHGLSKLENRICGIPKSHFKKKDAKTDTWRILDNTELEGVASKEEYTSTLLQIAKAPRIQRIIDFSTNNGKKLDKIILIGVDLSKDRKLSKEQQGRSTTPLLGLIQKILRSSITSIPKTDDFFIEIDMLKHYKSFLRSLQYLESEVQNKLVKLSNEEVNIYFASEGGRSPINFALIQVLIRNFRGKNLFHISIDSYGAPFNTQLPVHIERDLNRNKIKELLKENRYASIVDIASDVNVQKNAQFAYTLTSFDLSDLQEQRDYFREMLHGIEYDESSENELNIREELLEEIIEFIEGLDGYHHENSHKNKLKLMYLTAKIKFQQHSYADFLFRLFTLLDYLLVPEIVQFQRDGKLPNSVDFSKNISMDKELWKGFIDDFQNSALRNFISSYQHPRQNGFWSKGPKKYSVVGEIGC